MKKIILTLLIASTLVFTGCFKDDDTPIIIEETTIINQGNGGSNGAEVVVKAGGIVLDETWTNDKIYVLDRKVVVESGATLTIEAGTIIKGRAGTGSLASALIVARGGKINAVGTASAPIIFTSESDNIQPGETAGTNLSAANRGLWGGLLILGYAPCSLKGDLEETQIEGIPADDTFGLYGGDDLNDDSGVLQYVSIRHGGALIGEGNEINGLTLGGVGAGTTLDHIEVIANVDDGIEFFGGNVDASNLLVWAQGDDALDIDQGYSGTITNAVVVLGDVSDHGLEIDGREGSEATLSADFDGKFTINDLTLIGNETTSGGEYADYRSKATGATNNVFAKGFPASKDVELDNNAVAQNFLDGNLTFSNWEVVGFDNNIFVEKGGCIANCDDDNKDNDEFEATIIDGPDFTDRAADWTTQVTDGAQTVGANTAVLSWTYAISTGGVAL